ncbi:MAG: hypothetical protein KDA86_18240 [Planctomycetaceae bacterium]|nr:hypothetical protein [Planctomycetaceae bacterium]
MLRVAVGLVVLFVVAVTVCLVIDLDPLSVQALTILPFMTSLGLFTAGWSLSRGATRVAVSQKGLTIDQSGRVDNYRWEDIGWCTLAEIPIDFSSGQRRQLLIYGADGRRLAVLGDTFDNFDRMVATVKMHIDTRESSVSRAIQLRQARKGAVLVVGGSLLCLAASLEIGWSTHTGAIPDDKHLCSQLAGYGMSAVLALVSFLFAGLAVWHWRGWEIDLDTVTGRFTIKRSGDGE